MKLSEKIQRKMKERGIGSIAQLHRAILELYENEAITRPNLYRIINGHTRHPRLKNISQIATILDCPISEFYEARSKFEPAVYPYNSLAKLVRLNDDLTIKPKKILLKMDGKTTVEQEKEGVLQWIYVYKGEIVLHLLKQTGPEKINLSNAQHHVFDPSIPHYFETRAKTGGRFIIVNEPKPMNGGTALNSP